MLWIRIFLGKKKDILRAEAKECAMQLHIIELINRKILFFQNRLFSRDIFCYQSIIFLIKGNDRGVSYYDFICFFDTIWKYYPKLNQGLQIIPLRFWNILCGTLLPFKLTEDGFFVSFLGKIDLFNSLTRIWNKFTFQRKSIVLTIFQFIVLK